MTGLNSSFSPGPLMRKYGHPPLPSPSSGRIITSHYTADLLLRYYSKYKGFLGLVETHINQRCSQERYRGYRCMPGSEYQANLRGCVRVSDPAVTRILRQKRTTICHFKSKNSKLFGRGYKPPPQTLPPLASRTSK